MLFQITVPQTMKMLKNLSLIIDKATAHIEAKKFDAEAFLNARLAPDQFNFIKQVQIACDTAKLGVSRLTGKEAPTHPDDEKTFTDLKERIASTLGYLETMTPGDFSESATRKIKTPRWKEQHLTGTAFAFEHMIPNFYFHLSTAYAILRHNGVDIGKKDFLGPLPFKD